MPSEFEADALAKALHPFLAQDFLPEDLRARDFLVFIRYDRPLTDDPVVMGVEAMLYLFDKDDQATRLHGLKRIVAFIISSKNGKPMLNEAAIRSAAALLAEPVMAENAVRDWFKTNCC